MLVASCAFSEALDAQRVARAIGRGLSKGGQPDPDLCPVMLDDEPPQDLRKQLDALDFDERMRRARAVVLAVGRLQECTLLGSLSFEIASRARQAGVPAYAVTAEDALDAFDARILDLQLILKARTERGLQAAGRTLAGLA